MGDLEGMLASGCDFARKFDQTADGEVLDALERRVLNAPDVPDPGDLERRPAG